MSDKALPFVSIVMPCLNEEGYIEECIRSVQAQDYPRDRIEVLVVDGMSTDATREILARLAKDDPRIRVIDNPAKIQAAGMNEAIPLSRGDIVVRMDVHAEYAPDYVRQCVEVMNETGADNVGGAMRQKAKTLFQRAVACAVQSPLGAGGARYRDESHEGWVDTVYLGAFRRKIFETAGMYDRNAITNEDADLNQRIHQAGGRVYLSPKIVVHYYPRDSHRTLAKQYFKYGKGRARTLLKHGKFLNPRPLVPFFFTLGGAALLGTASPLAAPAFGAYALGTLAEAVRVGRQAGWKAVPLVWSIFPVLHVSHGTGFAVGLVHYALHKDWNDVPETLSSEARAPHDAASANAGHGHGAGGVNGVNGTHAPTQAVGATE